MSIRAVRGPLALLLLLATASCATTGRLAEYEFQDRTVGLVLLTPPRPNVFTGDRFDVVRGSWQETLLAVGGELVKEHQASELRERLDRAVARVDVAATLGDQTLERAARVLRLTPVEEVRDADFEVEVDLRSYGIAADGWDARAHFFVDAHVRLLDARDGTEVWARDVEESDPVNREYIGLNGPAGDVLTAAAMAGLEVHEIERALEALGGYAAEEIAEQLRRGWEKARR